MYVYLRIVQVTTAGLITLCVASQAIFRDPSESDGSVRIQSVDTGRMPPRMRTRLHELETVHHHDGAGPNPSGT